MGDRRFDPHYERVRGTDRVQVLGTMSDEEVISALAAASRAQDPYLANVLATAAQNRMRRANAISENIGEGLCTLDVHGAIQQINRRACDILGVTADAAMGANFHALVHPHHPPMGAGGASCKLDGFLEADGAARGESSFATKHGGIPVAISVNPLVVDEVIEARILLFQDIAQRKENEEILQRQKTVLQSAVEKTMEEVHRRQRAELRFRQLFEANPDPAIVTDADGRIVLLNASATAALGYADDSAGLSADLLLETSADVPSWGDLEDGMTIPIRRKDGSTFRADVASAVVGEGELRVTTLRDVTPRWLLDNRLRRQEALLKEAQRVGHMGSWEFTTGTGGLAWSDELFRIFGHEPGTLHLDFDTFLSHIHPQDRTRVADAIAAAQETGAAFEFEHRIVRPDGRIRTLRARGECERGPDGDVVRMMGTAQDVTREREMGEALRRSESRFNRVVESVPDGILILERDGTITYANPASGVTPAMLAQGGRWTEVWDGRVRLMDGTAVADLQEELRRIIDRDPEGPFEVRVDDPERGERVLIVSAVPLRDEGRFPAALVSFHDVTALHEANRRYADLNADLERRVERQTQLMRTANAELQAFSYSVSHDLQAPLRAIEFLADELAERGGAKADAVERIQRETRRMRQLVRDLLELAKLNSGEVERQRVDLTALARDILRDLAARDPTRQVEICVEDGLATLADPRLVRILLENLLGNAWKYTSRKGSDARIEVEQAEAGAFCVRDNGAGFDAARAVGLFQPFVRYHSATEYEGTGIGLATVHRIVQKHGGNIRASSSPGQGAAFTFTLDADGARTRTAAGPALRDREP